VLDEAFLVELQQDARTILRDLRDLAQGIHPSVLTDGGLVEAVEDRCSRFPLNTHVAASEGLRAQRFDDEIEGAAFFFVAESLANILKHARASEAHVDIGRRGKQLELTISDNGIGFDPGKVVKGGLAGLHDRFTALSGSVDVEATPGAGTVVKARLPVEGTS
jgi:signal transduction histidine kinase